MARYHLLKKSIAVGIISLFIGGLATSSVTVRCVHASQEHTLVTVTSEVCGAPGLATHTALITAQQYQELEQQLEAIKERLTRGLSYQQTIASIQEIVRALKTYQLLPQGASIDQVQQAIAGPYENPTAFMVRGKVAQRNEFSSNQSNSLCLISGTVQDGSVTGPLGLAGAAIAALGLILKQNLTAAIGLLLLGISHYITTLSPVSLLQRVTIKSGNITSVGLNGVQIFNISSETGEGVISGFSGIKITRDDTSQMSLLGFALGIKV